MSEKPEIFKDEDGRYGRLDFIAGCPQQTGTWLEIEDVKRILSERLIPIYYSAGHCGELALDKLFTDKSCGIKYPQDTHVVWHTPPQPIQQKEPLATDCNHNWHHLVEFFLRCNIDLDDLADSCKLCKAKLIEEVDRYGGLGCSKRK